MLPVGIAKEHNILLNANHLGVSKFINASEMNYVKVRDALVSAVDTVEEERMSPSHARI